MVLSVSCRHLQLFRLNFAIYNFETFDSFPPLPYGEDVDVALPDIYFVNNLIEERHKFFRVGVRVRVGVRIRVRVGVRVRVRM